MVQERLRKNVKKEKSPISSDKLLVSLGFSLLFVLMLVYLTFDAPILLNEFLLIYFPDYGLTWEEPALTVVADLRPLGYIAFFLTLILTGVGFLIKRFKLSFLGSIALYIPVFGYFAFKMFYFAGIGLLRILWMPIFDLSPEIFKFGDIVYLPYKVLASSLYPPINPLTISRIILGLGMIVLFISTTTWFYGKLQGIKIIDFGIYKYSRHPQYLGFLLWNYGILVLIPPVFVQGGYVPIPSLIWVLFALITIGIALIEEIEALKKDYSEYIHMRNNVPFMFPLPHLISTILFPIPRLFLKKDYPENKKEILFVLAFYGAILVFLSLLILELNYQRVFPYL